MLIVIMLACSNGNPDLDTSHTSTFVECDGDNNAEIDFDELQVMFGTFNYLTNTSETEVEPNGININGITTWDFSTGPNKELSMSIIDPSEHWFSVHFPNGEFASPISALAPQILGVFSYSSQGVELLGLASENENDGTLLVYDNPVLTYKLPLKEGDSWEQEVTFSNATISGVANSGEEIYSFAVDKVGTVVMGGFDFENTIRLRVDLEQKYSVSTEPTIRTIRYIYLKECFGELARIVSQTGETESDFKIASEFTRLSL